MSKYEYTVTEKEWNEIVAYVTKKKNIKNKLGVVNNCCATLTVIKCLNVDGNHFSNSDLLINNKFVKIKFCGLRHNEIAMPTHYRGKDVIIVSNGVDEKTFEICGYFSANQTENAKKIDTEYGLKIILDYKDIKAREDFVSSKKELYISNNKTENKSKVLVPIPKKKRTINRKGSPRDTAMHFKEVYPNTMSAKQLAEKCGINVGAARTRIIRCEQNQLIKLAQYLPFNSEKNEIQYILASK